MCCSTNGRSNPRTMSRPKNSLQGSWHALRCMCRPFRRIQRLKRAKIMDIMVSDEADDEGSLRRPEKRHSTTQLMNKFPERIHIHHCHKKILTLHPVTFEKDGRTRLSPFVSICRRTKTLAAPRLAPLPSFSFRARVFATRTARILLPSRVALRLLPSPMFGFRLRRGKTNPPRKTNNLSPMRGRSGREETASAAEAPLSAERDTTAAGYAAAGTESKSLWQTGHRFN